MPRTIPEWDLFRVLVAYLLRKQMKREPASLHKTSVRMGVGVPKMLSVLQEHNVKYTTIQTATRSLYPYLDIVIESIPDDLLPIFGYDKEKIDKSYLRMTQRKIKIVEIESNWEKYREKKEQERKKRMRYFLDLEDEIEQQNA